MGLRKSSAMNVSLLVPDMPAAEDLVPFLSELDRNRWYSNFGPLCLAFEKQLRQVFFPELSAESPRLVSCANGTAAIELVLTALDLPPGARVLLPAFTFPATATAVLRCGLTPVFGDVDPVSWQLTPDIARQILANVDVDAVLPVAALGMPQRATAWRDFAIETHIPVVIDAAAALGAQESCEGISVCYSLHATKSFGVGEGGVVVAASDAMGERIRQMANFGFSGGVIVHAGSNYKLSEYHAAVGLAQIRRVPLLKRRRAQVQKLWQQQIDTLLPQFDFQRFPANYWGPAPVVALASGRFHAAAALCLKPESRISVEALASALLLRGVQTRRWYAPGLHRHPAFAQYAVCDGNGNASLPVTDFLQDHLIGVPFHNHLRQHDIQHVVGSILASIGELRIASGAV